MIYIKYSLNHVPKNGKRRRKIEIYYIAYTQESFNIINLLTPLTYVM